ncbi:dTMP kinase [Mesorhizobium captivum]|uniref:dTMP kinase n=1 Tax=Mesorhizobium captivum TaxID=3072319 RepID=UPI002A23E78B|nr:dTMP kinase [Mesorhizobium sp. VK3C]MDX8450482.1 dTMP kinase [Mesorhizobium sp. VK3C]
MSEVPLTYRLEGIENVFEGAPPDHGCLISIDGFDGSGKSTQVEALARHLSEEGQSVVKTRQPTDWYRNDPIVRRFHSDGGSPDEARDLAMMAAVDRHRHVADVIRPALAKGATVICDRYVCSTFAVFTHRGVDLDFIVTINRTVPRPNFAFYIDVPTNELVNRLRGRDGADLKFEERSLSRIESIVGKWKAMRGTVEFVDGLAPPDVVTRRMLDRISAR